jgi:hypothetical protein
MHPGMAAMRLLVGRVVLTAFVLFDPLGLGLSPRRPSAPKFSLCHRQSCAALALRHKLTIAAQSIPYARHFSLSYFVPIWL